MMPSGNPAGGGFNFSQPQAASGQPANKSPFGTTTTTAATGGGFNFGITPSQPAAVSIGIDFGTGGTSGGFPLGQPAPATAPVTAQTSGFSFNPTQPVAATTSSAFSFGATPAATSTATGGFNLGASTLGTSTLGASTLTPASFGSIPTATTSATGLVVPTTATAPQPAITSGTSGFSFGLPATTSVPATGFSSVGTTATSLGTQMNKGLPFGFAASTPASMAATSTAAIAPVSSMGLGGMGKGLGGAQPPSANTDANSSGSKLSGKSTKDQQLPPDLFATIAVFESRKNAENTASEENIRQTAAPFHKIGEKAKEIQKVLAELASDHLQLQASTSNLKGEVMKEAEHVEMAKRTKETPMALQGDNKAPEVFFINLVRSFEAEMMYCRTKIEEVSQCMQAASNPCETQEDIAEVLQREHDTLKNLAAKVYAKHGQLVELSHLLKTKTTPNEQEFFRLYAKEDAKTPASSVVRPLLEGGGSGLLAFQEQQQRAKAVTLGAAPPTMPLTHTTTPSMFSGGSTQPGIFTLGPCFGNTPGGTNTFVTKPLFGNTPSTFGSTAAPTGLQQTGTASPFAISSPFNTKPFGSEEEDGDGRRKRRL